MSFATVLIQRSIKPGMAASAMPILKQLREAAFNTPGFKKSEYFHVHDDQNKMVVLSTWTSEEAWKRWAESETKHSLEALLKDSMEGETTMVPLDLIMEPIDIEKLGPNTIRDAHVEGL